MNANETQQNPLGYKKKKTRLWLGLALGLIVGMAAANISWFYGGSETDTPHIAKIRLEGIIFHDDELIDRIRNVKDSKNVHAAILIIDSPGGTAVGGEALFNEIRLLATEKPVVAQVHGEAASAAYMLATAADHIVAMKSSIVGSIGVLFEYPDFSSLMDKIGIKQERIKSSPLKAEPSPFKPTTEEERQAMHSLVIDIYGWFMDLVAERRSLNQTEIRNLSDGRVYTGRQALGLKLIDRLGSTPEALEWLNSKGINENIPIVEWKPDSSETWMDYLLFSFGLNSLKNQTRSILSRTGVEKLFLHGLVSMRRP